MKFETNSVYKGEVPFLTFTVENEVVGKLYGTGGKLSFEGNVEKSAEIFFKEVINKNDEYLKGLEQRNAEMVEALEESKKAISSLEKHALGIGTGKGGRKSYPIRDELLSAIEQALRNNGVKI